MSYFIVQNTSNWEEKLLTEKELKTFFNSTISKKDLSERFSQNYKPWIDDSKISFSSKKELAQEMMNHLNSNPFSGLSIGKFRVNHIRLNPKFGTKYQEFYNEDYSRRRINLNKIQTAKNYYSITVNPENIQIYFSSADQSCFLYAHHNGNSKNLDFLIKEIQDLCKKDKISNSFLKNNLGTLMSSNEYFHFSKLVNKRNF